MYKFDRQSKSLLQKQEIKNYNRRKGGIAGNFKFRLILLWLRKIMRLFGMEKEYPKIKIDKQTLFKTERVEIKNDNIISFLMRMLKLSVAACLIIIIWLGFEHTKNYALKSETFLISAVNINGCSLIPETYIKKLYLDYCNSKGVPQQSNIFTFNINELHKYIMDRCNAIESIYISKNFDYSIGINIIERKPAGIFFDNNFSKLRLIDEKLNIFDIQDIAQQNYIFLSKYNQDFIEENKKNDDAIVKLVKITNSLNASIKSVISEIEIMPVDDVFILYLKNGVKALCHFNNYNGRLGRIDIILSSYKTEEIEYIDLRFKNIYLKLKKT